MANTEDTDVALTNGKEIAQFISALSQLTRASSDLERVKNERDGAVMLAGREVVRQLRELLRGQPELLAQIVALTEEATNKTLKEQAQQVDGKGSKPMGKKTMITAYQSGEYFEQIDQDRRSILRGEPKDFYADHDEPQE